jgi:hypothetical protein
MRMVAFYEVPGTRENQFRDPSVKGSVARDDAQGSKAGNIIFQIPFSFITWLM